MDQYFGMKELYQVVLKATSNMRIGSRSLEAGEPVTYFDHIQLASLSETVKPVIARGGRRNDPLVIWEDRQEVSFRMTAGVLNDMGLALLTNSKIINNGVDGTLKVSNSEIVQLDSEGKGYLTEHLPVADKPIFCFVYENKCIQQKIKPITIDYKTGSISFDKKYGDCKIIIDYYFKHGRDFSVYVLERERFNGLFSLEGKMYRKGEEDGENRTTLFRIPKVRIVSNLNIQLGELASPTVSSFNIIGVPEQTSYSQYSVMELYNFDEDIS